MTISNSLLYFGNLEENKFIFVCAQLGCSSKFAARCPLGDYLDKIDDYWGFLGQTVLALDHFILFVGGPIVPIQQGEKPHLNDLHEHLFCQQN